MNETTAYNHSAHTTKLKSAIEEIHGLRRSAFDEAMALSSEYLERRTTASLGNFSNLYLIVRARSEGRSVQVYWALYHFRNGRRVGIANLAKPSRSPDFDIATIKRNCPAWLEGIAVETELKCRPLREVFARLTEVEQGLRFCATRLGVDLSGVYSKPDKEDLYPNPFPEW